MEPRIDISKSGCYHQDYDGHQSRGGQMQWRGGSIAGVSVRRRRLTFLPISRNIPLLVTMLACLQKVLVYTRLPAGTGRYRRWVSTGVGWPLPVKATMAKVLKRFLEEERKCWQSGKVGPQWYLVGFPLGGSRVFHIQSESGVTGTSLVHHYHLQNGAQLCIERTIGWGSGGNPPSRGCQSPCTHIVGDNLRSRMGGVSVLVHAYACTEHTS